MAHLDIVPFDERQQRMRHQETIDALKAMLADAEAGEIVGIVAAVERADGSNVCVCSGTADRFARAGRLDSLKMEMLGYRIDE